MAVEITQFVDNELFVNDKLCYKDANNNWIAKIELTTAEQEAVNLHVKNNR